MNTLLRTGVLRHKDISPIGSACCLLLFLAPILSAGLCVRMCVCVVCADSIFFLCPRSVCLTYKMQQTVLFVSLLLSLSLSPSLYLSTLICIITRFSGFTVDMESLTVWFSLYPEISLKINPCTPL